MKKRKLIVVRSIKQLNKTKNAQGIESAERFSFYEDRENFCIYTLRPGEQVTKDAQGNVTAVGTVKIGDEIIGIEEEVTTSTGETVKQYYFLTNDKLENYVKRQVSRDVNLAVDNGIALARAEHAKELAKFDLEKAMSGS